MKYTTAPRIDCNWMVKEAAEMRARLLAARLEGVEGLEARLAVKIAVRFMDAREVSQALADEAPIAYILQVVDCTEQDAKDYFWQFGTVARAIRTLRADLGCHETH